jgi:hypothetical protein
LLGCRSPAKNDKISPLLLFTRIVLMKSLLTLNLAAMAPSPSIALKKSLSLLRAIGLSAGLVASVAMMAPAQAATSGTIQATATVPDTCTVGGADIAMAQFNTGGITYLMGRVEAVPYSTGRPATFSVSRPILEGPSGYTGEGGVYTILPNNEIGAFGITNGIGQNFNVSGASSGTFAYEASVNSGAFVTGTPGVLPPGNYKLVATITCVSN